LATIAPYADTMHGLALVLPAALAKCCHHGVLGLALTFR
jgi:hypothetical protein